MSGLTSTRQNVAQAAQLVLGLGRLPTRERQVGIIAAGTDPWPLDRHLAAVEAELARRYAPDAKDAALPAPSSGRGPLGERAMTPAERQAKYWAKREAGVPSVRYRRPPDRRRRY